MKLRAQITIDMDADDYIAAAEFQHQMQVLVAEVRARYAQADLDLRERRTVPPSRRRERPVAANDRIRRATGALHLCEEG